MEHRLTLTGLQDAVGARKAGGLDVVFTKLAVDLQNLVGGPADPVLVAALETLREEVACDAIAVLLLDDSGRRIQQVLAARSAFALCNPEVLTGLSLDLLPWLDKHFEHLRVHGIANTDVPQRSSQSTDATHLAAMGCGALLHIGFNIHGQRAGCLALFFGQPQPAWSVEHTLLLKLMGSSLASGLERIQTTSRLAEINEREELLELTVNDGTWDFDALNNRVEYSHRWKRMMGYADEDLARNAPDWRRIVHVDDYARLQARLRDEPEFAREYRVDPERIALLGHSMGGAVALISAAELAEVRCVASLAGANLGALAERVSASPEAAKAAAAQFQSWGEGRVRGVSGEAMIAELLANRERFTLTRHAATLATKPTLLVAGARDDVTPPAAHHAPLVAAIRTANGTLLEETTLDSDHAFSETRIALADTLVAWLASCRAHSAGN